MDAVGAVGAVSQGDMVRAQSTPNAGLIVRPVEDSMSADAVADAIIGLFESFSKHDERITSFFDSYFAEPYTELVAGEKEIFSQAAQHKFSFDELLPSLDCLDDFHKITFEKATKELIDAKCAVVNRHEFIDQIKVSFKVALEGDASKRELDVWDLVDQSEQQQLLVRNDVAQIEAGAPLEVGTEDAMAVADSLRGEESAMFSQDREVGAIEAQQKLIDLRSSVCATFGGEGEGVEAWYTEVMNIVVNSHISKVFDTLLVDQYDLLKEKSSYSFHLHACRSYSRLKVHSEQKAAFNAKKLELEGKVSEAEARIVSLQAENIIKLQQMSTEHATLIENARSKGSSNIEALKEDYKQRMAAAAEENKRLVDEQQQAIDDLNQAQTVMDQTIARNELVLMGTRDERDEYKAQVAKILTDSKASQQNDASRIRKLTHRVRVKTGKNRELTGQQLTQAAHIASLETTISDFQTLLSNQGEEKTEEIKAAVQAKEQLVAELEKSRKESAKSGRLVAKLEAKNVFHQEEVSQANMTIAVLRKEIHALEILKSA
eukprot:COSAG01_NODE_12245_length_1774_cov_4296.746269_1_plen_545_part_01